MDTLGRTAIWLAPTTEIARMLIAAGASVDARDHGGFTALMSAAQQRDPERVHELLAAGANPNARDVEGRTPLLIALSPPLFRQNVPSDALITELLRGGARVDVGDRQGLTPLMYAVRGGWPDFGGGWPDIVRVLLAAHADVNVRSGRGATALSIAEQEGQTEIVRLLKRAGAGHAGP
jgi:ankyrin repeat protein